MPKQLDQTLSRKRPLSPGIPYTWRRVIVNDNILPPIALSDMIGWCEKNCTGRYSYGTNRNADRVEDRSYYAFWFKNIQDHVAFALIWG